MIMDSVNVMGLKACIVHPIGMQGSFNLCDVRDMAAVCISAVDKGRIGEAYILANEEVTLKEMFRMILQAMLVWQILDVLK